MKEKNSLYDAFAVEITEDVSDIEEELEYQMLLLEVSKALFQYRKAHNLSQVQLAEKLQVNQVMVSKLEKGTYNPTIKLLYSISRKLGNSAEWYIRLLKDMVRILYRNQNIQYQMYETYRINGKNNKKEKITYISNHEKEYSWKGEFYGEKVGQYRNSICR